MRPRLRQVPPLHVGIEIARCGVLAAALVASENLPSVRCALEYQKIRLGLSECIEGTRDHVTGAVIGHEERCSNLLQEQRKDVAFFEIPSTVLQPDDGLVQIASVNAHALQVPEFTVNAQYAIYQLDHTTWRRRVLRALDLQRQGQVVARIMEALQPYHAVCDGAGSPTAQRLHGAKRGRVQLVRFEQRRLCLEVPFAGHGVVPTDSVAVADTHRHLADVRHDLREHDAVAGFRLAVDLPRLHAKIVGYSHLVGLLLLLADSCVTLPQVPNVEPRRWNAACALHFNTFASVDQALVGLVERGITPGEIPVQDVVELPPFLRRERHDLLDLFQRHERVVCTELFHPYSAKLVKAFHEPRATPFPAQGHDPLDDLLGFVYLVILQIDTDEIQCNA
mmetsp:Transcript_33251/g.91638  ORF Transcript_33251/g.91638 Transcript_33251/m.91638 type:complete len:393 (+) Transcript_33251:673-1851(+)